MMMIILNLLQINTDFFKTIRMYGKIHLVQDLVTERRYSLLILTDLNLPLVYFRI